MSDIPCARSEKYQTLTYTLSDFTGWFLTDKDYHCHHPEGIVVGDTFEMFAGSFIVTSIESEVAKPTKSWEHGNKYDGIIILECDHTNGYCPLQMKRDIEGGE